jgi:hypothetical protein
MWRARFGRSFGPVIRQSTKEMNVKILGALYWQILRINLFLFNFECLNFQESIGYAKRILHL